MKPGAEPRGWHFAIDRGGTFTDVVGVSPSGALHTLKVLSRDPLHAGDPAVRGMESMLAAHDAARERRVRSVRLGTTVATNALLERKGDPTLLVTTRGLGEALRIGYQNRPDIFARAIHLPPPLYTQVVEADERIDAGGTVLTALDEARLRGSLERARASGLTSVAIVFMHGFRHPQHERRAAAIAREVGFQEVSTSHEVAPLLGFVARGDTTVADAYLSPVLLRYVDGFGRDLASRFPGASVEFMQSNGGLTDAAGFRGVNALLSGPAGGVVGMIEAGGDGGRDRIIGLDMGGTSTDLSLYAGDLPRRYLSEIDGVRVQAPMMDIHTIAAGGGSIVRYADGRLQVGPESAGADPGPACYRRGGPATITDCNLVLGRIQAGWFPEVFGERGDAPLDVDASRRCLAAIAAQVAADRGGEPDVETLASGFIDVAVARMSYAVRELALRQGHDPSQFALLCFGGAAGQHACAIAQALGCREIVLPALAGVLSAWGIGHARARCVRRRTVETALDSWSAHQAEAAFETLAKEAREPLLRQGIGAEAIGLRRTAQLRFAGSDSALEVAWAEQDAMRAEFAASYRRTYGFLEESQPLIVAAVAVEAVAAATDEYGAAACSPSGVARPSTTVDAWIEGGWQRVPLHPRAAIRRDTTLTGPALIAEDGATSFIAPGWSGSLAADGNLVLRQHAASGRAAAAAGLLDPTRLEVMNGLFMHVAEQMGVVLQQTASSVNIKERLDFSCAIFDAQAQLVANAPHMPVHLGSMGASVAAVVQAHGGDLRPGDAYLVNSPYDGGTHLPDLTVVTPVFDDAGTLRFYAASRAHHADVGGVTPGSMPPGSRHIDEEGVLIPATRIVRDGRLDEPLLRRLLGAGACPARNPGQNLADLRAQLAANARGIRELERAALADRLRRSRRRHAAGAGQRRSLRAAGNPPARGRRVPLRARQRADDPGPYPRRPRARHSHRRLHRHLGAAGQQLQRATRRDRGGRAVCVPHADRGADPAQRRLSATAFDRGAAGLDARPALAQRRGGRQRRDFAVHRRRALRGSGSAGGVAGHDEQFHVRQRALPVLRDDRRRRRRRTGLRWRERRADAHDQLAAHGSGSARKPLPGAAAPLRAPRWIRRKRADIAAATGSSAPSSSASR